MQHDKLTAENSKERMAAMLDKDTAILMLFVDEEGKVGYMAKGLTAAHVTPMLGTFQSCASNVISQFVEQFVTLHMASTMVVDTGPQILKDVHALRALLSDDEQYVEANDILDRLIASAIKLDVLTQPLNGVTDEDQDETADDGDGSPNPPHTAGSTSTGDNGADVCVDPADDRDTRRPLRMPAED